jgi:hypothetical protein
MADNKRLRESIEDINTAMEALFRLEAGLTYVNHATAGSEI